MNPDFPRSFQPGEKPWITTEVASTEKIIAQVKKCQSEALSYFLDKGAQLKKKKFTTVSNNRIRLQSVPKEKWWRLTTHSFSS